MRKTRKVKSRKTCGCSYKNCRCKNCKYHTRTKNKKNKKTRRKRGGDLRGIKLAKEARNTRSSSRKKPNIRRSPPSLPELYLKKVREIDALNETDIKELRHTAAINEHKYIQKAKKEEHRREKEKLDLQIKEAERIEKLVRKMQNIVNDAKQTRNEWDKNQEIKEHNQAIKQIASGPSAAEIKKAQEEQAPFLDELKKREREGRGFGIKFN